MDNTQPAVKLRVQQTDGSTIEHEVGSLSVSVGELKASLSERTGIPAEKIRLMLDSQILGDDEQPIRHYGIGNNSMLRLVQLARGQSNHPRNVSGINNASSEAPMSPAEVMGNQARQMFMSNPQLAQTLMMSNPQMREAMENNPELRQMMTDPEVMQQSLNAAQNPRLMQEVQRNNDRVLSNLESAPGGYAHIRRMYHNIQEPLAQAADSSMRFSLDELNRRRARVMGVTKPDSSRVNTTPLPNPWAKRSSRSAGRPGFDARNPLAMVDQVSRNTDRLARLNISSGQSASPQRNQSSAGDPLSFAQLQRRLGPLPALISSEHASPENTGSTAAEGTAQSPSSPQAISAMSIVNPNYVHDSGSNSADLQTRPFDALSEAERSQYLERFHSKLKELEDMGFSNREKNLRALIACQGDMFRAIDEIIGNEDN